MYKLLSIILIVSMSFSLIVGLGVDQLEAAPSIPQVTNLKVEELRNGYVNISFDPVPGASHYVAKRNGSNIGNINYQTNLEHQAPMTTGVQYTYEISAVVDGIQGPAGSITVATPETTPSPLNLVGTSNSPTSIQLSWDPVPNATDYVIAVNPNKRRVGISTIPGYEQAGLMSDSTYIYYVQARIGDVYSDPVTVRVKTLSSLPLAAPANFRETNKTHNSISLSWTAVTGANKYVITDGNDNIVYDGSLTSTIISNLSPNTDYIFNLVAIDSFGQSSPSANFSGTTESEPIPQVTGLIVKKIAYNLVHLIWNPVTGAESYTLYRDGIELVTSKNSTYNDILVLENTKYIYGVTANIGGRSSQSVLKEITTPTKPLISPGTSDRENANSGNTTPQPLTSSEGNNGNEGSKEIANSPKSDEVQGNSGRNFSSEGQTESVSSESQTEFKDVQEKHFANDAISELSSKGIIKGYNNGTFAPNKSVTRAEFAIMLKRALGLKSSSDISDKFKDFRRNAWYADELSVALQNDISNGFTDNTLRPNQLISREQAAVMISNVLRDKGFTYQSSSINFKDLAHISIWAYEDVKLAVEKGIIKGYVNNTFLPRVYVSRGEAAVLIQRLLRIID